MSLKPEINYIQVQKRIFKELEKRNGQLYDELLYWHFNHFHNSGFILAFFMRQGRALLA